MKIFDRLINLFFHEIHRTHKRRDMAGSSFQLEEVRIVEFKKEEADRRAKELIALLLSIHRSTNFAVCKVDDNVLDLINTLLNEQRGEEKDIQGKTLELRIKYAEELHDRIMEYVDWHEDTFMDFKHASSALNNAERIMQSTQIDTSDINRIIRKMKINLDRMNDKEGTYENEGNRKFYKSLLAILSIEATIIGTIIGAFAGSLALAIFSGGIGLYIVAYPTWVIFKPFYKKRWITGKERLFDEHEYYSPNKM